MWQSFSDFFYMFENVRCTVQPGLGLRTGLESHVDIFLVFLLVFLSTHSIFLLFCFLFLPLSLLAFIYFPGFKAKRVITENGLWI